MAVTKYNNGSIIFQNKAQWQNNTWAIALKETQMSGNQPRWLCSETSITLMTTGSSRICLHQ